MCNFCQGDDAIFWQNDANCAFVNSSGEMMVVANDKTIRFKINRCPMCGRLFKGVNYLNLRHGDDIWYADREEGIVEHGKIHSITIKNEKVDSFSVNFDNGDFDEFSGGALGVHHFMHKVDAEDSLVRSVDETNTEDSISSNNSLFVGDHIWYVDCDANEEFVENAIVEHVGMLRGEVEWFSAKFDNGDVDEFGPTALGTCCFKSEEEAREAWRRTHE